MWPESGSDFDGECVRVNTMRGFAKERNMRRDPRVTLLCYDPRQPLRYLEVRGTVIAMTEEGAAGHLDALASKYAGRPIRYFGDAIPARFAETETPILCRIRPDHVVALDARRGRRAMSTLAAPEALPIPASHLDLLMRPICGVLTTMGPDGRPESSLVWGGLRRRVRPRQHDARASEGAQPAGQPEGQPARRRPRRHGSLIQIGATRRSSRVARSSISTR